MQFIAQSKRGDITWGSQMNSLHHSPGVTETKQQQTKTKLEQTNKKKMQRQRKSKKTTV
jgi:hypothetical protein